MDGRDDGCVCFFLGLMGELNLHDSASSNKLSSRVLEYLFIIGR